MVSTHSAQFRLLSLSLSLRFSNFLRNIYSYISFLLSVLCAAFDFERSRFRAHTHTRKINAIFFVTARLGWAWVVIVDDCCYCVFQFHFSPLILLLSSFPFFVFCIEIVALHFERMKLFCCLIANFCIHVLLCTPLSTFHAMNSCSMSNDLKSKNFIECFCACVCVSVYDASHKIGKRPYVPFMLHSIDCLTVPNAPNIKKK